MPWTPLILDSFIFDEAQLEVPETSGDMGGTQSLEQHDFPGGTRTQKAYGYFPAAQKWRAKFHGTGASDRAEGVKRIMAAGREVKLQYGFRSWLGRVARFTPTARHTWHFEYELEFWPRIDYGSPGPTLPGVTDLGTVLGLHILSLQSLLTNGLSGNLLFQALAAELGGPVGFLVSQVQGSIAAAGGVIGNVTSINQQAIYQASLAALAACAPYLVSPDPTQSSPASDAASRIQAIQTIMGAAQPTKAVLQTINPNLLVLAAQYYGDATQWRTIANANGLADPQPTGSYSLVIPQQA
jgi:hypothetical protein